MYCMELSDTVKYLPTVDHLNDIASIEEIAFSMSKIHFLANDEVTILQLNRNAKNDKKVQEDLVIEAKRLTRTP